MPPLLVTILYASSVISFGISCTPSARITASLVNEELTMIKNGIIQQTA